MQYMSGIKPAKITPCKTEIMNGIQEVSLTGSITPANTGHPFREAELAVLIVFELKQGYLLKAKHSSCKITALPLATDGGGGICHLIP